MVILGMLSLSLFIFLTDILTMRALVFALPSILLSQLSSAVPAYLSPEYDASRSFHDPDGNKLGAVASESSICSHIGINTLKEGGNAADSLVATVLWIGVVGMYHRSVGNSPGLNSQLLTIIQKWYWWGWFYACEE